MQLSTTTIRLLEEQGCTADDWNNLHISSETDPARLRSVNFIGNVTIGNTSGSLALDGTPFPCGIYNATVANCIVGDHVRIANVGSSLSNYRIEDDVLIQDVGSISADADADFGTGVRADVLNEGGGRATFLFSDLTSQTAYLQAVMRHNKEFSGKLSALIEEKASLSRSAMGTIGSHACVTHCGVIRNVNIGAYARLWGASYLQNGTINSCKEHPTEVGSDVHARGFIVAEGSIVEGGALLEKTFVGQGVKIGKQFSAENSLFFANCEGFHGEAVSLFAGPYTVTHHKSTLLIAGMFSFYNAGSGTNQSNHMYKLGPVHQGVFERGCKTGSSSYVLMESRVGAFSVVIGKHYVNMNTPNLPFSYIHEEGGVSRIIPGMNLFSVGTVRDGEKWPKRDNRRAPQKRDLITFDVFSPYTVEKMRKGRNELLELSDRTPKEKAFVNYGGLQLNRLLLRKGAKYYSLAINRYLNDKVCARLSETLGTTKEWKSAVAALRPTAVLQRPTEWTDICGLLTPLERLDALENKITRGSIASYDELLQELRRMYDLYREDEWSYICAAFAQEYHVSPDAVTKDQALQSIEEWGKAATSLHSMILEDSKREFGAFAKISYGLDQHDDNVDRDFEAVRGSAETNAVVQKLMQEGKMIEKRRSDFRETISSY